MVAVGHCVTIYLFFLSPVVSNHFIKHMALSVVEAGYIQLWRRTP
jgi:hypothetical protein